MIIYKVTNKVNGKCYIGQTRHSLNTRKKRHLSSAKAGMNTHFYQALRKYGEDNFYWEIICTAKDKQTLNELETFYITKFDSIKNGYNMVDGGDNNVMDIESVKTKHDLVMQSPEVRAKISKTMKQLRKEKGFSNETRKKISEKLKGNHNFGTGDTRSIGCYCVLDTGEQLHFHSYRDAWNWWKEQYNVFDTKTECVYQRKIKQSIKYGYYTYHYNRNSTKYEYPKWYKEGGDANEKVTD